MTDTFPAWRSDSVENKPAS